MGLPILGTVTNGSTDIIDLPKKALHIQVDAQGGGTLAIGSKVEGQPAFTAQTSITDETVILDLVNITQLEFTASVADVNYAISLYSEQ